MMENPYYDLISLIRAQSGQVGNGLFSATVSATDDGVLIMVEDEPVTEDFWLPQGLEITDEDDGATVLCQPFDQGFLILCKLAPL